MRSTIPHAFLLAFSSLALCSAQQLIKVTPQSLSDWTLTGADLQSLSSQPALTLPAGAQLARSFPSGDLALKITTQPQFGAVAADWPVLELGSAALVFASDGTAGRLSLVVDDGAPVDLPGVVRLDTRGRSVEPLTVVFTRKDGQIIVTAAGQKISLAAGPVSGPKLDVVASAGAGHEWSLEQLEVLLPQVAVDALNPRGTANSADGAAAKLNFLDPKSGATAPRLSRPTGATAEPGQGGDSSGAKAAAGAGAGTLEIFTPSSVRHGRADTVRNTVATGLKK